MEVTLPVTIPVPIATTEKTGNQVDATIDDRKDGSKRYLALVRPNSWKGWRKIPEIHSNSNSTISNNNYLQPSSRKLAFSSSFQTSNRFSSLTDNDDDDSDSDKPTPTPLAADSGCTIHLADKTNPLLDEVATPNGITITTASSDTISGISKGQLPFNLPKKSQHLSPNSKNSHTSLLHWSGMRCRLHCRLQFKNNVHYKR